MAHGYRNLQQWDLWLTQHYLGGHLLQAEELALTPLMEKHFGKHALLIGVPNQYPLLNATVIPYHSLVTPLLSREKKSGYIEGDFHELPILTGSIDFVLLPHTLEFVDNPRQLLAEACRIIKPEGLIAICGFNPNSLWGLRRFLNQKSPYKPEPWATHFIYPHKIKNWLQLADFELEKHTSILYRPPLAHSKLYDKLHYLEKLGRQFLPIFGGAYVLLARAKVIPLTPIKLKWKQQLDGIRITSSITGHIATRHSTGNKSK